MLLNVAFLVIVLILHHGTYTYDYIRPLRQLSINKYFQKLAVGGFLFLSGYKLTESKRCVSTLPFLINRFIRIYPVYLLALVVHSFTVYPQKHGELPSLSNFFLHAGLLQYLTPGVFGGNYTTIWFVSILFFCYLFFLGTRNLLHNFKSYLFYFLILLISIYCTRSAFAKADINVFAQDFEIYLGFFAGGMLYSVYQDSIKSILEKKAILLGFLFSFSLCWLGLIYSFLFDSATSSSLLVYVFRFFATLLTTLPLYFIALGYRSKLEVPRFLYKLINDMSFSSFFVFLFHRPVWSVMQGFWPDKGITQSIYILLVGLPIIFGLSYLGQSTYSALCKYVVRMGQKPI